MLKNLILIHLFVLKSLMVCVLSIIHFSFKVKILIAFVYIIKFFLFKLNKKLIKLIIILSSVISLKLKLFLFSKKFGSLV